MAKKIKYLGLVFSMLLILPTSSTLADQPKFGAIAEINYIWQDWVKPLKNRGGSFNFERFAVTVDGRAEPFDYSAEYTWYPYMHTLMHAWLGFDFSDKLRLQGGVTDVPFGLETYSFNNWWGDMLFYMGLNTNMKSGLSVKYGKDEDWVIQGAIFKNDVFGDLTGDENNSYYYNLTTTQQEVGQVNGRIAKTFHICDGTNIELGASAQKGWIQNKTSYRVGHSSAYALHSVINFGMFNLQLQETIYSFNPKDENILDIVTLGAYAATYTVPSKGRIHTANISFSPDWEFCYVKSWVFYNDFSMLDRSRKTVKESFLNTVGFYFNVGENVIIYNDLIWGKNMPYIGITHADNIGMDHLNAHRWGLRYNLNIGVFI